MTEIDSVAAITRRRRPGPWRRRGLWLLILGAVGLAGYLYLRPGAEGEAGPSYLTGEVRMADITVKVSAVGSVEPIQQVEVGSLIAGTISKIAVAVNQKVVKGQVLARLDTSSLEAALAGDQATLAARRAEVEDALAARDAAVISAERARRTHAKGLISAEDLVTASTLQRRAEAALAIAEANVKVAEAEVTLSQTNLAKAVIVSPIDGMVLDVAADLGQTVSVSSNTVVLFTLAHDLGQMELKVDVDEADIGKVALGDPARFTVDAYLGESFPAEVSEMHYKPTTVDGVVTYPTILAIDNSDLRLRPGMTASADVTVEEVKNVLTLPNAALRYAPPLAPQAGRKRSGLVGMIFPASSSGNRGAQAQAPAPQDGSRMVYVLRDGRPNGISIRTGVSDGEVTQVLEGALLPGDHVITAQSSPR